MGGQNVSCDSGGGGKTYYRVPPPKPSLEASDWKRLKGKNPEGKKLPKNFSEESNLPRRFRRYPEIL